jgi:diaminopimelate decarboxylase
MNTIAQVDIKELANEYGTPLYVYDEQKLTANYHRLKSALDKYYKKNSIHFTIKANNNISVLKAFRNAGSKVEATSPIEILLAESAGFSGDEIFYNGNYESREDLEFITSRKDIKINLDDYSSFERLLEISKTAPERISFRINPGIGRGGFEGITTAGSDAKFGIPYEMAHDAYQKAKESGVKRFGIHMMTGSNNLEPYYFAEAVDKLMMIAHDIFSGLDIIPEFVNIGGGFGVPYYDDEPELDVDLMAKLIAEIFSERCHKYGFGSPELILEPGRYLIANAGYLISQVTGVKDGYRKFVGIDAGMGTIARPSLYGAFHRVKAYDNSNPEEKVNICGQYCENSDILAKGILLPQLAEGNLVTILDAGAYCYVMASSYNSRPIPAEVMVWDGEHKLIRRRETMDDYMNLYNF